MLRKVHLAALTVISLAALLLLAGCSTDANGRAPGATGASSKSYPYNAGPSTPVSDSDLLLAN